MVINYVSDLHAEFNPEVWHGFPIPGDVLVMAGDIVTDTRQAEDLFAHLGPTQK